MAEQTTQNVTQPMTEMETDTETTPIEPEPECPLSPDSKAWGELMAEYACVLKEQKRLMKAADDLDEPFCDPQYLYHEGGDGNSFRLGCKEERTNAITECARQGLELYNEENKTDYYFDGYVDLNFYVEEIGVYCYHCNFLARPKTAPIDDGDFTRKLFFAEICDTVRTSVATCCAMLDGEEAVVGCGICPGLVHHPTSGFTRGFKSDEACLKTLDRM